MIPLVLNVLHLLFALLSLLTMHNKLNSLQVKTLYLPLTTLKHKNGHCTNLSKCEVYPSVGVANRRS